jgi:hypothetical protein
VLQPPSVEMTVGMLIKIGCLLEGAEMTTCLLVSTGHVLKGVAMITGPLIKKTCMLKGDGFHRVLYVQCRMVWKNTHVKHFVDEHLFYDNACCDKNY